MSVYQLRVAAGLVLIVLMAFLCCVSYSFHQIAIEITGSANHVGRSSPTRMCRSMPNSSEKITGLPAPVANNNALCLGLVPEFPFLPYDAFLRTSVVTPQYAYVTFITSPSLVAVAATLMYSIAVAGSLHSRCILVTSDISLSDRRYLALFAQVILIKPIASPIKISNAQYSDTFTKLRIWELEMLYTKVLYIDADVIVLKNMDDLFDIPVGEGGLEWAAPRDGTWNRYSTGLMLIRPSLEVFDAMMHSLKKDTTKKMMRLPDLLFLNHFFSRVRPKQSNDKLGDFAYPQVAIIPRWYQIYQAQLQKPHGSYLEPRRAQKITIFDHRIHGIHYPNKMKPWDEKAPPATGNVGGATIKHVFQPFSFSLNASFIKKLQTYSTGFCAWKDYVRYFSLHANTRRVDEHYMNLHFHSNDSKRSMAKMEKVNRIKRQIAEVSKQKLKRLQQSIVTGCAVDEDIGAYSSYSKSESFARVNPFESDPNFWWFLKYYEMTLVLERVRAQQSRMRDISLDDAAATAQFNSENNDNQNSTHLLKMLNYTKGTDLKYVMLVDYRFLSDPEEASFVYRTQLVLGASWGFNREYSVRGQLWRNKSSTLPPLIPISLHGASLTSLAQEWRNRGSLKL